MAQRQNPPAGGGLADDTTLPEDEYERLMKLQRKYRVIDGNRKAYTEQTQNIIRKQTQSIENLQRENERLRQRLSEEALDGAQQYKAMGSRDIRELEDKCDGFQDKIEKEERKVDEHNKQIKILQRKLIELRREFSSRRQRAVTPDMVDRQIGVLENRLEQSYVKGNEAAAANTKLRAQIDNLRKERIVFDGVHKKLQSDLASVKQEIEDIVEESSSAYEQRDKIRHDIAHLRTQVEKDAADFEREWKELGEVLEKDKKMQEFFKLKEKVAAEREKDAAASRQGEHRASSRQGPAPSQRVRATQQQAAEQVHSYEEAFRKIKDATGVSDIDQLVSQFISAEDRNFSLFNYANELQNEVERLEDQVASLRHELERHRKQDATTDSQRRQVLAELEAELAKVEAKDEEFRKRYEQANERLVAMVKGVERIFTRIGCSEEQLGDTLGAQGITQSNLVQHLGAVEQRTTEVVTSLATAHRLGRLEPDVERDVFYLPGEEADRRDDELMEDGGFSDGIKGLVPAIRSPTGKNNPEESKPGFGESPEADKSDEGEEREEDIPAA